MEFSGVFPTADFLRERRQKSVLTKLANTLVDAADNGNTEFTLNRTAPAWIVTFLEERGFTVTVIAGTSTTVSWA